jgi:MYXO-CTERM domain-containing protein
VPHDRVVASGGGGFICSVHAAGSPSAPGGAVLSAMVALAAIATRRRRSRTARARDEVRS